MTKLIDKGWLLFENIALPKSPDIQTTEMKLAFYAGIYSALTIIKSAADDHDESKVEKITEDIYEEALEYLDQQCWLRD